MHRFFALFMVLLLAARGLLGDAMAMGLSTPHEVPPAVVAEVMHAGMHASHATHEGAQAATQLAEHCHQADADSGHCANHSGHSCSACGICHSALANPALPDLPGLAPEADLNATAHTHFASAAPAQASKPPIS